MADVEIDGGEESGGVSAATAVDDTPALVTSEQLATD